MTIKAFEKTFERISLENFEMSFLIPRRPSEQGLPPADGATSGVSPSSLFTPEEDASRYGAAIRRAL